MSAATYPARVNARLDQPLSPWLWLAKWILVLPHYVVLLLLWLAFTVLSVVAGAAILATGRYPRGIFETAAIAAVALAAASSAVTDSLPDGQA